MPDEVTSNPTSHFVDIHAVPWQEIAPGARMKVLYKNNEARQATILVEIAPGGRIPEHIHTGLEQTYVFEGAMHDADGICSAGNFVVREPGSSHEVTCPDGARFLVFFQEPSKNVETGGLFPDYGKP
jgi:anti-sigma factor ChrR (cupin superfamily)